MDDRGATFTISHYAGSVVYNAGGFAAKNNDSLHADLIYLISQCCALQSLGGRTVDAKSARTTVSGAVALGLGLVSGLGSGSGSGSRWGVFRLARSSLVSRVEFLVVNTLEASCSYFVHPPHAAALPLLNTPQTYGVWIERPCPIRPKSSTLLSHISK